MATIYEVWGKYNLVLYGNNETYTYEQSADGVTYDNDPVGNLYNFPQEVNYRAGYFFSASTGFSGTGSSLTYDLLESSTTYYIVSSTSVICVSVDTYNGTNCTGQVWTTADCDTNLKGTYIENIIAEENTYPDDGVSGSYWYVLDHAIDAPSSILLNYSTETIYKDGSPNTLSAVATVLPDDAETKAQYPVQWQSSNESVATVTPSGTNNINCTITAVGRGSCTITATAGDYNDTISITVKQKPTSVTISNSSYTLSLTGTTQVDLDVTVSPASAESDYPVSWSSSNESIATVNSTTGLVTAQSAGNCTITVTCDTLTDTCDLTVETGTTGISLSESAYTLYTGNDPTSIQLTALTVPDSSDITSSATWESNNTSVATVSGGLVSAVGIGACTITATYSGFQDTCTITVYPFMKVNIGGSWKQVINGSAVNIGGTWKQIVGIWVNIGGTWKKL